MCPQKKHFLESSRQSVPPRPRSCGLVPQPQDFDLRLHTLPASLHFQVAYLSHFPPKAVKSNKYATYLSKQWSLHIQGRLQKMQKPPFQALFAALHGARKEGQGILTGWGSVRSQQSNRVVLAGYAHHPIFMLSRSSQPNDRTARKCFDPLYWHYSLHFMVSAKWVWATPYLRVGQEDSRPTKSFSQLAALPNSQP